MKKYKARMVPIATQATIVTEKAPSHVIEKPQPIIRETDLGNPNAQKMQESGLNRRLFSQINYTCDNSADSVDAKVFIMFDAIGAVTSAMGADSGTAATPVALSAAIINKYFAANAVMFSGMRISLLTSESQFDTPMYVRYADLDGQVETEPFYIESAVTGEQYDRKIQNYKFNMYVTPLTGVTWSVAASERAKITWYAKADFNRS